MQPSAQTEVNRQYRSNDTGEIKDSLRPQVEHIGPEQERDGQPCEHQRYRHLNDVADMPLGR
ncbi:hypothetical protein D3C74_416050 [compost metagenome]